MNSRKRRRRSRGTPNVNICIVNLEETYAGEYTAYFQELVGNAE
jgi:hypothetical protein